MYPQLTLSLATSSNSSTNTQNASSYPSLNSTASQGKNNCPEDRSTIIGGSIGAVLGAALLAAIIVIALLLKRSRSQTQPGHEAEPPKGEALDRAAIEKRLAELEAQLRKQGWSSSVREKGALEMSGNGKFDNGQMLESVAAVRYELGLQDHHR